MEVGEYAHLLSELCGLSFKEWFNDSIESVVDELADLLQTQFSREDELNGCVLLKE
jgi:hypothetical protein